MWGGMAGLVLQLIAGAVGGSVIGTTIKRYDLGMIGNLLAGIVGGGIGAQIIGALVGGGEAAAIVGPDGFEFRHSGRPIRCWCVWRWCFGRGYRARQREHGRPEACLKALRLRSEPASVGRRFTSAVLLLRVGAMPRISQVSNPRS